MTAWLHGHADILLYLAPSLALALAMRALTRRHPIFFVFTLAGTLCHELVHLVAGFVLGARPASFTVIPKRAGQRWELGSVVLTRVTWYNAAPSALAPLLLILVPWWVAVLRTRPGWHFQWADLGLAFLLAPQLLAFWPSNADWKIAWRSWPALFIVALAWLCFKYGHSLMRT
ncbi:hypothetical protein IP92_05734 [Pseudoduganella flava]|uniref:M50 family peptidase n=1 Tax=Pseudoduganella flava TaxID=871742 RepID=A0A562P977_9BURK|nr:hypothetical protein [Pseudoduganella flava]TWI41014.1 hypothetical protein IP92_05734 [Pseudoduganella flava]